MDLRRVDLLRVDLRADLRLVLLRAERRAERRVDLRADLRLVDLLRVDLLRVDLLVFLETRLVDLRTDLVIFYNIAYKIISNKGTNQ